MSNNNFYKFIIFAVLLVVILPLSIITYKNSYKIPEKNPVSSSDTTVITNPEVLENSLPSEVINDVKLKLYASSQSTLGAPDPIFKVEGDVTRANGRYVFKVVQLTNNARDNVSVDVINLAGFYQITTYVNDKQQTPLNAD